jgi:hypothetical protein
MIPFFTPIKPTGTGSDKCMAAYIASINHNRIDSKMVASIMSTMKGNYCRDASKDSTHLQDMGSDAAVLFGYYDDLVSMSIKILSVCLFLLTQILS